MIGSAVAIYLIVLGAAGLRHQDLDAYLAAARDIWHGAPLYAAFLHHPFPDPTLRPAFIYPPAFALLIAPLGLLPDALAGVIWLLICQTSLIAALALVLRWRKPTSWAMTALVVATFTFYPLWIDVAQGQANLPIVLLVTIGVVGIVQGRPRFGAALGVAAALKLTPIILLVWLLLDRRFRAVGWMVGAFAAVGGVGALFRFHDTIAFIGQVLPALAPGVLVHLHDVFLPGSPAFDLGEHHLDLGVVSGEKFDGVLGGGVAHAHGSLTFGWRWPLPARPPTPRNVAGQGSKR